MARSLAYQIGIWGEFYSCACRYTD